MKTNQNFYLVTGFHRSGTSLLAQTLSTNGIDMGQELMGATFSNPLGHVEDMPVVRLHDKVYSLNGTDWRYHDSSPLIKPVWLPNYISSYIEQRQSLTNQLKAVKDPRATHFLKEWQVAGNSKQNQPIRFVFIYRHWRSACYSLLNRHARHLLNNAHPIVRNTQNFSFWRQANLAYKMWLSANKRILEFVQNNPNDCLLISQASFVAGKLDVADETFYQDKISRKLSLMGLKPAHFKLNTYKHELLTSSPPQIDSLHLSAIEVEELELVFSQLETLADLPSPQKAHQPTPSLNTLNIDIPVVLDSCPDSLHQQHIENVFENARFYFEELTWPEFAGALLRVPLKRIHPSYFFAVLEKNLGNDFKSHAQDYFSIAKVAHRQGLLLVTKVLKMRAMLCSAIESNLDYQLDKWNLFCEPQFDWIELNDDQLVQANPFSTRLKETLPGRYFEEQGPACDNKLALTIELLTQHTFSVNDYIALASTLNCDPNEAHLREFCLFKALRLAHLEDIKNHSEYSSSVLCLVKLHQHFIELGVTSLASITCKTLAHSHILPTSKLDSYQAFIIQLLENERLLKAKTTLQQVLQAFPEYDWHQTKQLVDGFEKNLKPHSGLKHRFALQLHSLDYSNILSIAYEDERRGKILDTLNQRVNFLSKDNKAWLYDASHFIQDGPAKTLVANIYKHWCKVFPANLVDFVLEANASKSHKTFSNKLRLDQRVRLDKYIIVINIESVSVFEKFACLASELLLNSSQDENESRSLPTLVLYSHQDDLQSINKILECYALDNLVKFHHKLKTRQNLNSHVLLSDLLKRVDASYIALVQCNYLETSLEKSEALLTWYSLLGYEFDNFKHIEQSGLDLVLPSYHPEILLKIQAYPLFYPIQNSFIVSVDLLKHLLLKKFEGEHEFLLNLVSKCRANDSVKFMHHLMSEHFV